VCGGGGRGSAAASLLSAHSARPGTRSWQGACLCLWASGGGGSSPKTNDRQPSHLTHILEALNLSRNRWQFFLSKRSLYRNHLFESKTISDQAKEKTNNLCNTRFNEIKVFPLLTLPFF